MIEKELYEKLLTEKFLSMDKSSLDSLSREGKISRRIENYKVHLFFNIIPILIIGSIICIIEISIFLPILILLLSICILQIIHFYFTRCPKCKTHMLHFQIYLKHDEEISDWYWNAHMFICKTCKNVIYEVSSMKDPS